MAISFCTSLHTKGSTPLPGPGPRQCKYTGQSVRALPIRILTVGKKRSRGAQLVFEEYIGKLKHYCSVDDVQIRSNPRNAHDLRAQVDDEDSAIMNLIKPDDWVVMLDENGQDIRSEQMAELVGDAGNTVVYIGLKSSDCIACVNGAAISVMDYSERTEIPSLAIHSFTRSKSLVTEYVRWCGI